MRNKRKIKEAADIKKRFSPEELRQVMQLTDGEMAILDQIASGKAPRNSIAILNAIKLKAEFAYSKPKQEVEHSGGVNVIVEINRKVEKDDE